MYQGLASSTHCTYSCAQETFVNFCIMTGHVSPYGSPCQASEWTLCFFATYLANSLRHSSIKVYLSAVQFLFMLTFAFRVVRGIKCSQGALPSRPCLPFSSNILRIIYSALDLDSFENAMFYAACLLAYFVVFFLRSAKFTVSSLSAYNPSVHLSVSDVSVDVPLGPYCLKVFIKAS